MQAEVGSKGDHSQGHRMEWEHRQRWTSQQGKKTGRDKTGNEK
jgi:hypothetical protein